MKTYEMIQRATDGGFPIPNDGMIGHGESVYVVSKRELISLLYRCKSVMCMPPPRAEDSLYLNWASVKREIEEILTDDFFLARGPDLPERRFSDDMEDMVKVHPSHGWGTPANSDNPHYFNNGHSVCKRWTFWGDIGDDTPDKPCKECVKKLVSQSNRQAQAVKGDK